MVQTIQMVLSQTSTPEKGDVFSQLVGQFGRWQFMIFFSVFLVKLSSGWVQMAITFLTPNLTFWCSEFSNSTISENVTLDIKKNICDKDCVKYEYDTGLFNNTIVSEWDLICDRQWLAGFTQMMLQLGILIGSVIFGFLSDRFGRKITFLTSVTLLIIFGFAIPFSPNYAVFTSCRFLLGVAVAGTMVVSFVIVMESVGSRYRELIGCLFQIPFNLGHMTVPLFAYYFRSWDSYTLALAVPPVVYVGYFFLLTESPRWLISVGRVDEATAIVTNAAKMNNLPTTKIKESLSQLSEDMQSRADEPKPNYLMLFHPSLRLKTIGSCCIWLVTGITFFGLNQYIGQTSPDPFISVSAAGAIQIPSVIVSIWLIQVLGRKVTVATFSCLGGLCIVTLGCLPKTFAIELALGTLGVSCASVVATTSYIYTSELYPTVVRNMGLGASSTVMRIGSMLAPFISNYSSTIPWLPTLIFGLAPICAGAVCLFLPETKGVHLPDSMEDVRDKN